MPLGESCGSGDFDRAVSALELPDFGVALEYDGQAVVIFEINQRHRCATTFAIVRAGDDVAPTDLAEFQVRIRQVSDPNRHVIRSSTKGPICLSPDGRPDVVDQAIQDIGEGKTGAQGDIVDLADPNRLFETVRRKKGHIDVLFTSAGPGTWASSSPATGMERRDDRRRSVPFDHGSEFIDWPHLQTEVAFELACTHSTSQSKIVLRRFQNWPK